MGIMHFDFMSDKLGYQTNIYVVLPDCVREGKALKGVLYLLHGGSGNGLDWLRNVPVERYVQNYDVAVVMPETDGSSFYADMKHGYPYFTYLTEEVPVAMEAMLPALKGVKRYVAGFSMGGYGAFKWAFNKPDFFQAAANFSGVSFIVDLLSDERHQTEEKLSMIECNWGSIEALKGSDSDSKFWIERAAAEKTKLPRLFVGVGTEDYSYPMCAEYLKFAKEHGIDMHYEEMSGGHEWSVWDEMLQRFLKWI